MWNLRVKTPDNDTAVVPWHQDNAYFDDAALYTFMPTAWVPLIDANMTNGCMQVGCYTYIIIGENFQLHTYIYNYIPWQFLRRNKRRI